MTPIATSARMITNTKRRFQASSPELGPHEWWGLGRSAEFTGGWVITPIPRNPR